MVDEAAIKVEHVSKTFRLPHEKNTSIKSAVINSWRRNRTYEAQEVLKDVSFEIKKGEFFGIVGRNGSGKSTLLKLLAGIYSPTEGKIEINGKLTPFIELGVGFNPELTGRENVYLNGALLGFNRKEMSEMYEEIVSFAELERFMDQKLKNYSSGMQVRLAFSIAIRAKSDILLIDEVLAVGDAVFQQKCFDYFKTLKQEKKTVVFVSHDSGALQQYCDKGILIENGEIVFNGAIEDVVNKYKDSLVSRESASQPQASKSKRWGDQTIEVVSASINGKAVREQAVFTDTDETLNVKVTYKANKRVERPVFGITINDLTGQQIFASNTLWSQVKITNMEAGDEQVISWSVPNVFNKGTYNINPAVSNSTGSTIYDWRENLLSFKVRKKLESTAVINIAHNVTVKGVHS